MSKEMDQFWADNKLSIADKTQERLTEEANAPSTLQVLNAAARSGLTGYTTANNMIDRGSMMPNNEGSNDYFTTPEYKQIIKEQTSEDISTQDLLELSKAKNSSYLTAAIGNQQRYNKNVEILESSGGLGTVAEMAFSMADVPSWLVGGVVFKGAKAVQTTMKVQKSAANSLFNMGAGGLAGYSAIQVSEGLIQAESNIRDSQRRNDSALYGAAFGVALPLFGHTIKGVASGEGRKSIARGLSTVTANMNQDSSIARFLAISSGEQLRVSKNSVSQGIAGKADVPVRAGQDEAGNYIVSDNDTAMNYRRSVVDGSQIHLETNVNVRAKENNVTPAEQAMNDGDTWAKATNSIEQDARSKIGDMNDNDLITMYEKETGTTVKPYTNEEGIEVRDLPDDVYDVAFAKVKKDGFDNGSYHTPEDLDYIQSFWSRFGEEANTYKLKGIAGKDSRGYDHIKYNSDAILADRPGAQKKFEEMLRADNLNKKLLAKGLITEESIVKQAANMVEGALDRDLKHRFLDSSKGSGSTSATKQRTLRMDRSMHPDMFVTDIGVKGSEYADKIGGKLAMKKTYDIDTNNLGQLIPELDNVYLKIREEGMRVGQSEKAIKKDIDNAKAIFETVIGSRKYSSNPDSFDSKLPRLLRKSASALYNAGFVRLAIVEPTVAIMRFGLPNVLKNFLPAHQKVLDGLKNIKPKDPIIQVMKNVGLAGQTLRGMRYDRYDTMEITPTTGKTEMWLDKVAHAGRKYSGFNYVNDVSDHIAGGAALDDVLDLMKRPDDLSGAESSRMARYGLSSEDLKLIAKQDIKYDKNGVVTDYNFNGWKNQDVAKRTMRYLQSAVTDTIMRADGTRVHRWQSDVDSGLKSMMFQFSQMPTALYERLLLNSMDEMSARTVVGMIAATGMTYAVMAIEDTVAVATGAKDKATERDELLLKAVTRTPYAGILPNFIDAGLLLSGRSALGSSYAPRSSVFDTFGGAGVGVANKIFKTVKGAGDGLSGQDTINGLKLVPILNSFPITKAGMQILNTDIKGEGQPGGFTPYTESTLKYLYENGE